MLLLFLKTYPVKYRHLFFDLDRTLWDYETNARDTLEEIFHDFQLDRFFGDPGDFLDTYHRHNEQLWQEYRDGKTSKEVLRSERFERVLREKECISETLASDLGTQYLERAPSMTALFPGTVNTLEYLREKGYHLYILTNGFLKTQQHKLKNSRIDHYFLRVFSSDERGVNKPSAEIFHWAVTSLNARKKDCLMIGDDLHVDVAGAMRYGIDAIWFNPRGDSGSHIPTGEIRSMEELRNWL